MRKTAFLTLGMALCLMTLAVAQAAAQQHRATRLGSPATRFAPPLTTPEDLRRLFSDARLRPDIASILDQWGWKGNLDDLLSAAATNTISDVKIPVGTRMPFMSSRERGKPVTLRDVLWAGKEPAPAYTFEFSSKGRGYRCVTPKACSNFFLEDLGAPFLTLDCSAPGEVPVGRPVQICLTLRNTGDAAEPQASLRLPFPEGAVIARASEGALFSHSSVTWEIPKLEASDGKKFCAVFNTRQPGSLPFAATASGALAPAAQTGCETRVVGIPAILIDAVDLEDPIEVGSDVIYDIKVTNQGSLSCTNVRLVCTLPESEEFVSGTGPTPVLAEGRTLTTEPLSSFAPKSAVTWRVIVKALKPDDARFKINLSADQFVEPIFEEEPTQLY